MDNAYSLGLVSYDIGSGEVLPDPLVLENSLSSTDNSDVFEFKLDQENGLFVDYTSNGDFIINFYDDNEELIKSSTLSAANGAKEQRFFNFESGSYFLEFKSEQNEQIDYTAELSFGLSDVEVENYARSGAWYNAELRTDLGIATANAKINQEGYLIWQNGHSDHHQWLSDSFEFEVLAPTSVKVSYDAVQNPAWINLHIDDVIEQSNPSGSDTVSIDLLPGVHTVRLSGDGKDGAPTKYVLKVENNLSNWNFVQGTESSDDLETNADNTLVQSFGGADNINMKGDYGWARPGLGADFITVETGKNIIELVPDGVYSWKYYVHNVSSSFQQGTEERVSVKDYSRFKDQIKTLSGNSTVLLSETNDAYALHDLVTLFDNGVRRFNQIHQIHSQNGDDIIDFTSKDYSLAGQNIKISGGNEDDIIWGSDADENIFGDAGNDVLFGGAGTNILTGGSGADEFQFTKTSINDHVEDFSIDEGDTLKFFSTGGAVFERSSAALENGNLTIKYGSSVQDQLTVYIGNDHLTILDISDALIIA